jgi:Spy/CpxP family protein refolding chaperone
MMKRVALALALTLVPAAAMAQTAEAAHKDHAKMMGQEMSHEAFVQSVIAKRAELELTDDQVAKLTKLKTKLTDHAKMMKAHEKPMQQDMKEMKHDGKAMPHGDPAMAELHKEFMAVFTDAQKAKVDALMKAHGHAEGKMKH